MIKTIDGAAFSRMMLSAAAEIDLNKQKVNELNVFPVPDGDTGTNMSMTLSAASTELRKADGITLTKAADKTASALLRGARGNSGVILSLLFRGFSKSLKGKLEADGKDFAAALTAGVEAAYKAVMKPAEGTILTVSRLTADAARDLAVENNEIEYVLQHCLDTAHAALDNTVNQNPVLKKAGVVDAGGMGFCLILRGMLESLRGNDIVCEDAGAVNEEADFGIFDSEDISFAFDTVFIVRKREDITSLDPLREYLGSIGDSLVIGEDDEAFKVHVHTNIPGDALSEAQKYGTLELAKIENMRLQHDDLTAGRKARSTDDLEAVEKELENQPAKQEAPAEPEKRYGSVAVCAGAGLAGVFRDLGVDEIIEGGQTMNPSTEDILHAIEKTPAEIVFVLPNNKNIIMAAQAAAELASREVVVIPTKTVPQGISAMLAFDASMEPSENEAAMTDCLSGVMTMQITYAARDSDFDGFDIHAGDYLGLCDGALAGTTREITTLLASLADKAAEAGKEFINIFYGADIQEPDAEAALELFRQHAPDAEQEKARFAAPIQRGDFRQLILHPPDGILRPRRRILRRDAIPKKAHRVADAGVYPPDHCDKRQRERQPNADGRNQAVARPVGNIQRQQEKQNGVEHKAKPLEANLAQHPKIPLSNEANVLRFDGARRFQPAYFLPFGLPLAYSHHARRVQLSQAGFRAAHTRRP